MHARSDYCPWLILAETKAFSSRSYLRFELCELIFLLALSFSFVNFLLLLMLSIIFLISWMFCDEIFSMGAILTLSCSYPYP